MESPDSFEHLNRQSQFPAIEYDLLSTGIDLDTDLYPVVVDGQSRRIILIGNTGDYPSDNANGVHGLLLDSTNLATPTGERGLIIPENSAGLTLVLNEAVGSSESLGVKPSESRTLRIIGGIFKQLFAQLETLQLETGMLPTDINIEQLLVSKDDNQIKLLPPLRFKNASESKDYIEKLRNKLLDDLRAKSTTPSQRNFAGLLSKVISR